MSQKFEPFDFKKFKVNVENVQVKGLSSTKDRYVLNQLGDIFKANNFEELLNQTELLKKRLIKLGCFKSVYALIDASSNNQPNSFEIIFNVEELGRVGGGIHTSIGNNDGSLNTSINIPNVFGKGERISAEYVYGTKNQTDYRLNYVSPINLNPEQQFSWSVFRSSFDNSWSKFKQNDTGINLNFLFPYKYLLKNKYEIKGTHIYSYEGVWRHLQSAFDSAFIVREQSGHSLKSSLKYTNLIDRRNHPILPTNGGFLKIVSEIAGFGGDVNFFRFESNYQYSKTFFDYLTAQITLSNGFVSPLKKEENVSIADRFYLGGPMNLRGFTNRGAGLQDEKWNFGNSLNGLINNYRLSVGTGIVISFGKIARAELNYAVPLCKSENDKIVKGLQFGIGVNFD